VLHRPVESTGVTGREHLRASHIKPWRLSSDAEKLDGHNGLLLSPHIDHLFDRGYITFSDAGEVVFSKRLLPEILNHWSIPARLNVGAFSDYQ